MAYVRSCGNRAARGSRGGWEELPYWIRGYADLGYVTGDATVISTTATWVNKIVATQQPDGFFGPTALRTALGGGPDFWQGTPSAQGPSDGLSNQDTLLTGLWAPADTLDGGWMVGANGGLRRFGNGSWESYREGNGSNLSAVWVDAQRAVAVGDSALTLTRTTIPPASWDAVAAGMTDLKDLWIAPDDAFRVYVGIGRRIREGVAQAPGVPVDDTFVVNINAVWGTSQNDLWAVGSRGEIWHRDATGWSRNLLFPDGGPDLFDIDGRADGGAYIVGQGCTVLQRDPSFDGGWRSIKDPGCADDLYSVWAAPQNGVSLELMTVGAQSNRAWQRSTSGTWIPTDPKGRGELLSVWGTSPTDIYASGEDGVLTHFDGTGSWEVIETGTRWPLRSVRGQRLANGQLELFLVGQNATVLRAVRP